ncbi:MAG: caspase family protein, partial [Ferruginibacter sp.]
LNMNVLGQTTTTLYSFQFHFLPENKMYDALLYRNKNGTGYIRIRFEDSQKKPVVIALELDEHYDQAFNISYGNSKYIDSNTICFEGKIPKVIIGNTTEVINKMVFRFKKTESNGIYYPLEIIMENANTMEYFYAEPTTPLLLTAKDLTAQFKQKYFKDDELFLNQNTNGNLNLAKADTLYFVSVANTTALNIGPSCNTDRDAMKTIFKAIANTLGLPIKIIDIYGDNFNADNVHDAIKNLNPALSDIVIFYYSGHGFIDKSAAKKFPKLDLRSGVFDPLDEALEYQIEDLYKTLLDKNARFTLVLSDCCNDVPGAKVPISKNAPSTRSSPIPFNKQICKELFLNTNRFAVLLSAASKGEAAAGFESDGGIFTFNFRETLVNVMNPLATVNDVSWSSIINETFTNTIKQAPNATCAESNVASKKCLQHPIILEK